MHIRLAGQFRRVKLDELILTPGTHMVEGQTDYICTVALPLPCLHHTK